MVQHNSIDHSGVMSYASNANQTSTANYGGAASTVSRGDHVHLSTGGSGAVAIDAIWDAAGDLAVGTGANTAARLAKGAAGANLSQYNGVVGWNGGTSFPATPASGDRYWRSDLRDEYFYDGTRWLTTTKYDDVFPITSALEPHSGTVSTRRLALPSGTALWVESVYIAFYVTGGTALSASHKWVVTYSSQPGAATFGTITIDSGASDAYRYLSTTVNAALPSTDYWCDASYAMTGTPGTLHCEPRMIYRRIGT